VCSNKLTIYGFKKVGIGVSSWIQSVKFWSQWHVRVSGNEHADRLAGMATEENVRLTLSGELEKISLIFVPGLRESGPK
jgi:hypothetical protein